MAHIHDDCNLIEDDPEDREAWRVLEMDAPEGENTWRIAMRIEQTVREAERFLAGKIIWNDWHYYGMLTDAVESERAERACEDYADQVERTYGRAILELHGEDDMELMAGELSALRFALGFPWNSIDIEVPARAGEYGPVEIPVTKFSEGPYQPDYAALRSKDKIMEDLEVIRKTNWYRTTIRGLAKERRGEDRRPDEDTRRGREQVLRKYEEMLGREQLASDDLVEQLMDFGKMSGLRWVLGCEWRDMDM